MIIYAELAVFVLFSLLIAGINIINFTAVGDDADHITERIASSSGAFPGREIKNAQERRMPQMGPESPEMEASTRYFTFAFDKNGNYQKIAFKMSSVTEDEAVEWARTLVREGKGWTRVTFRYRAYHEGDWTYVTVIDQSRELSPSYRVLWVSIAGELAALVCCLLILLSVSRRLFAPLEEANRKQEKFIASIENDFKLPLTLINANTEIIERENGASTAYTKSINGQVRKMTRLLRRLSTLSLYEDGKLEASRINFSDMINVILDSRKDDFVTAGLRLELEIAPDVMLSGDEEALKRMCRELVDNSLKFARSYAVFTLEKRADRIVLKQKNDTGLPNGVVNQVFDRFTTLENGEGSENVGLGLSYVKDIVTRHKGRANAVVENQVFELSLYL